MPRCFCSPTVRALGSKLVLHHLKFLDFRQERKYLVFMFGYRYWCGHCFVLLFPAATPLRMCNTGETKEGGGGKHKPARHKFWKLSSGNMRSQRLGSMYTWRTQALTADERTRMSRQAPTGQQQGFDSTGKLTTRINGAIFPPLTWGNPYLN